MSGTPVGSIESVARVLKIKQRRPRTCRTCRIDRTAAHVLKNISCSGTSSDCVVTLLASPVDVNRRTTARAKVGRGLLWSPAHGFARIQKKIRCSGDRWLTPPLRLVLPVVAPREWKTADGPIR